MSELAPVIKELKPNRTSHSIESFGGKLEVVDITPEHPASDVPVLIAGGWSEGSWSLEQSAEEISEGNNPRRVLLIDHARHGKPDTDSDYSRETNHRANSLLSALDELGIEKADVIAHSEGALDAVLAAVQYPEKFRSLVLVAPAGMIGEDSFLRLAGRFMPKQAKSLTKDLKENPKIANRVNLGGLAYISKNPAKATRELSAIANTPIDEVLVDLRQAGVHIGLIQSHADPVFPASRIEQHVVLDEVQGNVDAYASVAAKDAGHDDLLIHPERSTRAAVQLIEQFERNTSS